MTASVRSPRAPRLGIAGKKVKDGSPAAEGLLRNSQQSPLLRLPAELREMIYTHLLGGSNIVHIAHSPRVQTGLVNGVRKKCRAGFWCEVYPAGTNPHDRDKDSKISLGTGMPVVSAVCRQLYIETATMPMALNTLSFTDPYVMNRFVYKERRLSLAQRRAVKTMSVRSLHLVDKALVKHFGGLEMIYVHSTVVHVIDPNNLSKCDWQDYSYDYKTGRWVVTDMHNRIED